MFADLDDSTLTFAATDTTSSALSRMFHLLATHPEIQEKLREELITATEKGEDLDYSSLDELPYLDAVCKETLRLRVSRPQNMWDLASDVLL